MFGLWKFLKLAWIALVESITHPDETSIVSFDREGHAHVRRTSPVIKGTGSYTPPPNSEEKR